MTLCLIKISMMTISIMTLSMMAARVKNKCFHVQLSMIAASIKTLSMMAVYASQYNDTLPDKNQHDENQHNGT
jgi:hypothetical protein